MKAKILFLLVSILIFVGLSSSIIADDDFKKDKKV